MGVEVGEGLPIPMDIDNEARSVFALIQNGCDCWSTSGRPFGRLLDEHGPNKLTFGRLLDVPLMGSVGGWARDVGGGHTRAVPDEHAENLCWRFYRSKAFWYDSSVFYSWITIYLQYENLKYVVSFCSGSMDTHQAHQAHRNVVCVHMTQACDPVQIDSTLCVHKYVHLS